MAQDEGGGAGAPGPVVSGLEARLVAAVAGSPLAERVASQAAALAQARGAAAAADRLSDPVAVGLARVLASEPRVARYRVMIR